MLSAALYVKIATVTVDFDNTMHQTGSENSSLYCLFCSINYNLF